jgi:D-aminopeptidase
VNYKGGLGSASARTSDGITIGALAAVNAVGSVVVDGGPWFWAAPFEVDGEFGGRGLPAQISPPMLQPVIKGVPGANTTIVVVATDAILTKAQANRLAVMAQTGMARAIYPVHSPLDGDTLFAAATGQRSLADPVFALTQLGTLAGNVVARAIARGVFAAKALPGDPLPSWTDKFGH